MAIEQAIGLGSEYFNDPNVGRPVFNGSVYIGKVDLDPKNIADRITVTVIEEDGTRVTILPAAQPLLTGAGGNIIYNGKTVSVVTALDYSIRVDNSQGSQVYYFPFVQNNALALSLITKIIQDTVAVMVADTTLVVGSTVETKSYYAWQSPINEEPKGGAIYNIVSLADYTAITGKVSTDEWGDHTLTNSNIAMIVRTNPIDVAMWGASGDGITNDSAAIQAAMNEKLDVYFPEPLVSYLADNLVPRRGQVLIGPFAADELGLATVINGTGANPVFKCGDGGASVLRQIKFKRLSADGNGQSVILGRTSPDMQIDQCFFTTASAVNHTIDLDLCVRSSIIRNKVSASGGSWAIHAMNDCNGSDISHNINTGGVLGGAIRVGKSSAMSINNNIIESSLYGISLSETSAAADGNCTGVTINGNYLEQVQVPFSFGLNFSVFSLKGSGNYVGNTSTSSIGKDACIKWGRVYDSTFENNYYAVHPTEDVYQLHLNQPTGDQEGNKLGNDTIFGTPANVYTIKGSQAASGSVKRTVGWQNSYLFMSALSTLGLVVFESGIIAANVGQANLAFNDYTALGLGGKVTKIEVFEKTGVITSTLSVGRSAASNELFDGDPELLTYVDGRADASLLIATATIRDTESATYRVVAGVGAGTFRVRITYRVS